MRLIHATYVNHAQNASVSLRLDKIINLLSSKVLNIPSFGRATISKAL